ncbi:MAG: tetratricopeptide repeat protein [Armatimonadetes bacterium]|nr:tetratricopeptide repeat protein [Akkermansiaceae bacterium]
MAFFFRTYVPRRCFVLTIPIFLICGTLCGEPAGGGAFADRELERREAVVQEGQMLLKKGDEAYEAGKYEDAVAAYSGARESFPDAPATADLRAAATQRFSQASVELGRALARKGDVAGARTVMDKVLDEAVAPDDFAAQAFRAELDDPIRTNPALTKGHAGDVDQVRKLLYQAQGAYDLGKYEEARMRYDDVIRIDPFNKAARRGLERVSAQKSGYYGSAYDETRADFLAKLDSAWELPLAPNLVVPDAGDLGRVNSQPNIIPVSNKLSRIIIPEFRLEQANIVDAVDLLRLRAAENDSLATDAADKGINITLNLGDPTISPAKEILANTFDLQVSNVPLDQILKYITDITKTNFRTDDFAVIISPLGNYSEDLVTRSYRVPPDFLSNLSSGATAETETEDVFNAEGENRGLLARRMGAQEALALQGVSFPEGASASFNPGTNMLRTVNTPGNQDIIEQIIDSIAQTEPVSVAVRVTLIKVEENRLEELGFDWLLNNFGFGGASWIPGADKLNLGGGTTGNGTPITDIAPQPGTFDPTNPITAGNRSGDGAILDNSIDALIAAGNSRGAQANNRAPGVLGVNGILGGATVQLLMRGLDQKKGVDLMSQPSVTTRSGQAASIEIIREFIYPTEYEPPELPNSVGSTTSSGGALGGGGSSFPVTPATPTAFEKKDVGVTLEVLPVADANRQYVDVTLNPTITDFDGFVNYGSPINSNSTGVFGPVTQVLTENAILMPVFSVRKANTNLVVADGATIVIAGLLKDEIQDVQDKTPILGDLPVVGRLFQSNAKSHQSTVILFLVNVELLDPTGRPYRDR